MPLTGLHFSDTRVSDLSPLKGMPLTSLHCYNTQVSDLSPLEGMNLTAITFTPKNITKGLDVIRQMKSLKTIGIAAGAKERVPARRVLEEVRRRGVQQVAHLGER